MTPGGRGALLEACAVTAAAATLVRLQLHWGGWPARLSPAVWIYLPLLLLVARRLPLKEHGFSLPAWRAGFRCLLLSVAGVLLPFGLVLLAWRWGGAANPSWTARQVTALDALDQLALVAIPEELFFRGYVQGRLGIWARSRGTDRWLLPIVLTSVLFAAAHLLVEPGWLRAAVFLPGLVMSWLRARSGGLLAPAGFHWLANLLWLSLVS